MLSESNADQYRSRWYDWFRNKAGLDHLLYRVVLVSAATAPILFSPWHYNAFELPKAVGIRILASLALLLLIFFGKKIHYGYLIRQPLVVEVLALTSMLSASTLLSIDPGLSFWGSYDRQFGLLTWLALVGLFLTASLVFDKAKRRQMLSKVLIWGSMPVIIYAIIQGLGADPFSWDSNGASAVLGTMGRSNFLGSYLILVIPLTVVDLMSAERQPAKVLLLAGQIAVLGLTRARAAWLGLMAAAIVFGLLWLVVNGRKDLARRLIFAGLLLVIFFVALGLTVGLPSSLFDGGSTAARLTIWQAILPLLRSRPLLGFGPDTIQLPFQNVFPPELVYYQGRHLVVDRAHNIWLDIGVTSGLLGLAAYVFILLRAGRILWGKLHKRSIGHRPIVHIAIIAALFGHLTELQFGFETIGTAILFWLLLAAGVSRANPGIEQTNAIDNTSRKMQIIRLPVALVLGLVLIAVAVQPLLADRAYWLGLKSNPYSLEALNHFEEATQSWSVEPKYHLALGQSYWLNGRPLAATAEVETAVEQHPSDAQVWAAAGDLYARWAADEPEQRVRALAAYRQAVNLAPNIAAYHTALGLVLAESGQLSNGIHEIEMATALDATDFVAYRHLTRLYDANDQKDQAAWAEARAFYWADLVSASDS